MKDSIKQLLEHLWNQWKERRKRACARVIIVGNFIGTLLIKKIVLRYETICCIIIFQWRKFLRVFSRPRANLFFSLYNVDLFVCFDVLFIFNLFYYDHFLVLVLIAILYTCIRRYKKVIISVYNDVLISVRELIIRRAACHRCSYYFIWIRFDCEQGNVVEVFPLRHEEMPTSRRVLQLSSKLSQFFSSLIWWFDRCEEFSFQDDEFSLILIRSWEMVNGLSILWYFMSIETILLASSWW